MEKEANTATKNIKDYLSFQGIDLTEEQELYIKTEINMVLIQVNIEKMQFELLDLKNKS